MFSRRRNFRFFGFFWNTLNVDTSAISTGGWCEYHYKNDPPNRDGQCFVCVGGGGVFLVYTKMPLLDDLHLYLLLLVLTLLSTQTIYFKNEARLKKICSDQYTVG